MSDLPEFRMPACYRHFFTGHRWWCRGCDRETESQFRKAVEVLWTLQRETYVVREENAR